MMFYILKSSLILFILIAVYKILLENEKTHHFNRYYLLTSLSFGLAIPLNLISFHTEINSTINVLQLDEVLIQNNAKDVAQVAENTSLNTILMLIYGFAVLLLSIRFIINLFSFYKKTKNNRLETINGEKIVLINEKLLPHSFWNSIFINENDFENDKINPELLAHEVAHIQQKHSLDIIFIELLQIIFWFNPIIQIYKKAIKLNHEFLADQTVNSTFNSISCYQTLLLNMASDEKRVALASNINYLITKKRLIMMTKTTSQSRIVVKKVALVPLFISIVLISCTKKIEIEKNKKEKITSTSTEVVALAPSEIPTQPEYPGGMDKFYAFMGANYKMSKEAIAANLKGELFITFLVEKDGSLVNFKVKKDLGFGTGEEAIRVLKLSPKWLPGILENKPARVQYYLPIKIQAQ